MPCYFNGIQEREINFYSILKQYLELGYEVVVYWMNDSDINVKDKRLKVIIADKNNASYARNELLKIFYKAKEEFCVISDDDTFLKSRVCIDENIDCLSLTNDKITGRYETNKISTSFLVISNFKIKYNLEPFFDENLDSNQDLDFGLKLNSLGIKTHREFSDNVVIYRGQSSMFKNNMNKLNKKQKSLDYINKKWQI